eukprot:7200730-Ditylum_brightwellii.AAC.1
MLDYEAEEVWHNTFGAATGIISQFPNCQSELDFFYQNPMYYSRWYLNDIDGSFDCKGSTHTEQSHTSIVSHLGNGGNFSVAEHLKLLIERQVQQGKVKSENEIRSRQLSRKVGPKPLSCLTSNGDDDEKIEETMISISQPVSSSMEIQLYNSTESNEDKVIDTGKLSTYQTLLNQCEVLLQLIQHDKSKMAHFSDNITTWIERARKNLPIKVPFHTSNVDLKEDMGIIDRGRLSFAPNAANMKRLKSHHEKRKSFVIANKRSSNDDELCISNIKIRTCSLCGSKCHNKYTCPKVLSWGGEVLAAKDSCSWF